MIPTPYTPEIPSTIKEQYNDVKTLALSYRVLHPKATIYNEESNTTIRIPYSSVLSKYKDYLNTIVVNIELDEKEKEKYSYRPKLLSQDLYGTTELWDGLLLINNAKSLIDFKIEDNKVKVYDPAELKAYLDEIIICEKDLGNIEK